MSTFNLRLGPDGQLRLPKPVIERLGLQPGDELRLCLLEQVAELSKATDGAHPYADWRAISHDLIEDCQGQG